jgi:endonuclease III
MSTRRSTSQLATWKRQRAQKIVQALKQLVPRRKPALRSSNLWESLLAVMRSARCTDKQVNDVTEKLFRSCLRREPIRAFGVGRPTTRL